MYLFGPLFLSLFTHRLCGILEGGVPGHLSHYFPPQSGPGHKPHGAGHQPGLLPIHYSLSCQAGTGIKRNFCEALPSPHSVPGAEVMENRMERAPSGWGTNANRHPLVVKGVSVPWEGLPRSQAVVHGGGHLRMCMGRGRCWEETTAMAIV